MIDDLLIMIMMMIIIRAVVVFFWNQIGFWKVYYSYLERNQVFYE